MTLIMAGIANNGVLITADKRLTKTDDGTYYDSAKKLYRLHDGTLVGMGRSVDQGIETIIKLGLQFRGPVGPIKIAEFIKAKLLLAIQHPKGPSMIDWVFAKPGHPLVLLESTGSLENPGWGDIIPCNKGACYIPQSGAGEASAAYVKNFDISQMTTIEAQALFEGVIAFVARTDLTISPTTDTLIKAIT